MRVLEAVWNLCPALVSPHLYLFPGLFFLLAYENLAKINMFDFPSAVSLLYRNAK